MGKTKKSAALFLVVCLALSLFSSAMAEAVTFTDVDYTTTVGKAITNLVDLGVINGYQEDDGTYTFRPDNTISRSEFAKIIIHRSPALVNVLAMSDENEPSGFIDVDYNANGEPVPHWAKSVIALAAQNGFIKGYGEDENGNNYFKPDDPVKYCEAVTMLARAMGYEEAAVIHQQTLEEQNGAEPWYSGAMVIAAQKGLLRNVAGIGPDDPAPRGIVALITNNSYSSEVMVYDPKTGDVTGGGSGLDATGRTQVKGVLVGVYQNTLVDVSLSRDQICIDANNKFETYTLVDSSKYSDMLGYYVSGYVERIDGDLGFTSIKKEEGRNKLTSVSADTIHESNSDSLTYYPSTDSVNTSSVRYATGMKIVYNGRHYPLSAGETAKSVIDSVKNGTIGLLSNDNSDSAQVAFVNSYECFAVASVQVIEKDGLRRIFAKVNVETLYGDYANPSIPTNYIDIPRESSSSNEVVYVDETNKEAIPKAGDMVAIMRSKSSSGKRLYKVITSSKTQSGSISEYDMTNQRITIQNKTYEFARNYKDYNISGNETNSAPKFDELDVGTYVVARIDFQGKIGAIDPLSSTSSGKIQYGYLMAAARESEGTTNGVRVAIFTSAGKRIAPFLANSVKIDTKTYNSQTAGDSILTYLRDVAKNTSPGDTDISGSSVYQLIRYSTHSSSGKVEYIDTIGDDPLPESGELKRDNKLNDLSAPYTYNGSNSFTSGSGTNIAMDNNTLILFIPKDRNADDYYSKRSRSDFITKAKYHLEAYNKDPKNGVAGVILQYVEDSAFDFTTNTNYYLVQTRTGVTVDGSQTTRFSGYKINPSEVTSSALTCAPEANVSGVVPGDIISYTVNQNGYLKKVRVIMSAQKFNTGSDPMFNLEGEGDLPATVDAAKDLRVLVDDNNLQYAEDGTVSKALEPPQNDGLAARKFTLLGTVSSVDTAISSLSVTPLLATDTYADNSAVLIKEDINSLPDDFGVYRISCGDATIVKYSGGNNPVDTASVDGIMGISTSDVSSADRVFVFASNNSAKLIYILGK